MASASDLESGEIPILQIGDEHAARLVGDAQWRARLRDRHLRRDAAGRGLEIKAHADDYPFAGTYVHHRPAR